MIVSHSSSFPRVSLTARSLFLVVFLASLLFSTPLQARDKEGNFIVVIDAGHGGHDSGAKGKFSYEKDIVLAVSKKVGAKLGQISPQIKVYYSRPDNKFIGLQDRARFAISKNADLFVSIHANASNSHSPSGTETYVLGLHRTEDNLRVAMKENSAILLEDNYSKKYEDFDPTSSESYIIFQFMANKHLENSLRLAKLVQSGFKSANRYDRGVRQAGFLVLREAAMPSVLIEIGFISNREEERYLNSQKGQTTIANGIATAIVDYERQIRKRSGKQ